MKTKDLFGKTPMYYKGDIVVWKGQDPCIGRIKCQSNPFCHAPSFCFKINATHNSLHFSNLRLANDEERRLLGRRRILKISLKKATN